ncbi:unnamed protein product [Leptidea sinapis]|uniref:PEST proteolytic signal-containing nuclear protein n=1 Tax=Leptidea sinapis TaxID=189913 RepID=A0A5E4QEZ5_9NEOP|nr:unnamed protein product [Leptidea sinapis]
MSERDRDYKGSSRSTRDDSRRHADRRKEKSRSRSPRRGYAPKEQTKKPDTQESHKREQYYEKRKESPIDWDESDEEAPAPPPPPPPRISKISIDMQKAKVPIKMTLGGPGKQKTATKPTIASVFNDSDDDDEPEEMPAEARMRMRNIGRETPTSAGPNSFGKTKQGFCDVKKVFEKNLKEALDTAEKPNVSKLPQTIYKLKPNLP